MKKKTIIFIKGYSEYIRKRTLIRGFPDKEDINGPVM